MKGHRYQTAEERLWQNVEISDGCWEWKGPCEKFGYGQFTVGGKKMGVHRFSWTLVNGPVPAGMFVLHHCDNPPCVRPDHLWLGTIAENNADRAKKGRSATGDRHPNRLRSPLSYEAADRIRALAATGMTHRRIAEQFGVSRPLISLVVEGKRWAA